MDYPDPFYGCWRGSGSSRKKLIRVDPDPQHCLKTYFINLNINDDPTSTYRIYMIDTTYITLCLKQKYSIRNTLFINRIILCIN